MDRAQYLDDRPSIEVVLADGDTVSLVPVRAEDASLLVEGLTYMSPHSRYMRFLSGVDHLSASEIRYFTDIDQVKHVAWGALLGEDPAGIARYVVDRDRPDLAEAAVAVVDAHQRRGIGTLLLSALAAVARHDGVATFHAEVHPENDVVLHKMEGAASTRVDGAIQLEIPVDLVERSPFESDFIDAIESVRT